MLNALSEADIQFELCYQLRLLNIPFRLEFSTPAGRHDIAITDGVKLFAIVECKRGMVNSKSWQLHRYRSLNIDVFTFCPSDSIPSLVYKIKAAFAENRGRYIADIHADKTIVRKPRFNRLQRAVLNLDGDLLNIRR